MRSIYKSVTYALIFASLAACGSGEPPTPSAAPAPVAAANPPAAPAPSAPPVDTTPSPPMVPPVVTALVPIASGATDGTAAPAVNLRNNAATTPVLPAVSAASLPVDGTPELVNDLVARLQACYAIPAVDRVTAIVELGLASTETIKAAGCKSLFINNDPAQYLNNGSTVGSNRSANSFTGIFRDGGTGVVFDRGQFEYRRANGVYVLIYRWVDATGANTDNDQVVARNVGGKLIWLRNTLTQQQLVIRQKKKRALCSLQHNCRTH
jgi:hypothetical protein